MRRVSCLVLLFAALGVAGCGPSSSQPTKDTLSDQEKQQVKDLDQQRQDEWGKKKK
jgi:hypothetical protein